MGIESKVRDANDDDEFTDIMPDVGPDAAHRARMNRQSRGSARGSRRAVQPEDGETMGEFVGRAHADIYAKFNNPPKPDGEA